MRVQEGSVVLSASDLASHLACPHRTELERAAAFGLLRRPQREDPAVDALAQRGMAHEQAYLDALRASGLRVVECPEAGSVARGEARRVAERAMQEGADAIAQAVLECDGWHGRADVLLRVDGTSAVGPWSYEVVDTKLASETRAGTMLQLCLYCDLLAGVIGREPERFHVITPGDSDAMPFVHERHRFHDYHAYYRLVRRRLDDVTRGAAAPPPGDWRIYPEPVEHCDVCAWWSRCDARRHADDHLSLVANLARLQREELAARGITTLAAFAVEPVPLHWKPRRGSVESLERGREQARVQLEGRTRGAPVHELLQPIVAGFGLARLPAPSPGDLFLDLEGDPFVGRAGREYLFGVVLEHGASRPEYRALWALDDAAERRGFEQIVDLAIARWEQDPDMHVYHYAPYEPGALKRLMGRHATREAEVDRLLRGGRFVDLYQVVRRALIASVERYSIKDLEAFYGFERAVPLREVGPPKAALEFALEMGRRGEITEDMRSIVERYNRDDCESTRLLRNWLETLRAEVEREGTRVPRPALATGEVPEELGERLRARRALAARLTAGIAERSEDRSDDERARVLLADLLEFHRREAKAEWWEYFRLLELDDEDLLDEKSAIAGLEFDAIVAGTDKTPILRYRFPEQETEVSEEDKLKTRGPLNVGKVAAIDMLARTVDIEQPGRARDLRPTSVFEHDQFPPRAIEDALARLAERAYAEGLTAGPPRAWRDLLLGRAPRFANRGSLAALPGETSLEHACRLGPCLAGSVLPIQGPPGSGKTYTGARMIVACVGRGLRVGVVANSHKVIGHLLQAVARAAAEAGREFGIVQKVREIAGDLGPVHQSTDSGEVRQALATGAARVAGGTAWMWSDPEFEDAVDVLFVDEAGQLSLANAVAVGQAAPSMVLLGDPRQLDQPMKGSHPDGVAVSALEHLLGDLLTVPEDRGLFLAETWRLPPAVCAFTSEAFYEARLAPRDLAAPNALRGAAPFDGAGLWFVPVVHDGNQNTSPEEVEVLERLVRRVLALGASWIDRHGARHALHGNDVLIVAPYNVHVARIERRLAPLGVRVGTVDRFQGQEAPVAIYALATSRPEDAPRGMEFLYSLNRLNVATSRAQCASIVVGSPRLFEPACRSPRQMRLANAFCRYLEMATVVTPEALK